MLEISLSEISINDDGATLDHGRNGQLFRSFFPPAKSNLRVLEQYGYNLDSEPDLRVRCVLAMFAWRGCDCLVTRSAAMRDIANLFYPESNTMASRDALAVIGLLLRLREDFVWDQREGFRQETNATSFYTMLAHDLLTESWRWYEACPSAASPFEPSAHGLSRAIHERIARSLRARDRMLGGGITSWGIEEIGPDALSLDLRIFVE